MINYWQTAFPNCSDSFKQYTERFTVAVGVRWQCWQCILRTCPCICSCAKMGWFQDQLMPDLQAASELRLTYMYLFTPLPYSEQPPGSGDHRTQAPMLIITNAHIHAWRHGCLPVCHSSQAVQPSKGTLPA